MSALQNIKNFIRHGKQAKATGNSPPHAEPTTDVSNVHAHHQRYDHGANQHFGVSEPNIGEHKPLQGNYREGDFSAAAVDNRNVAAKAGAAADRAVEREHKKAAAAAKTRNEDVADPSVIERIVAEERESKGKLPRYPGLERWNLIEKMGDGAFSNVYRARDTHGKWGEVAIKVVRKYEMNSGQVSNIALFPIPPARVPNCIHYHHIHSPIHSLVRSQRHHANLYARFREIMYYIRTSRNNQRQWRCASSTSNPSHPGHHIAIKLKYLESLG